jgi:hypothetical protein
VSVALMKFSAWTLSAVASSAGAHRWARMTPISAAIIARSWAGHGRSASRWGVTSASSWSAIAVSSWSLFFTCQYSAIGVTPSWSASRLMVTASSPSASASASACATTARRVSRVLSSTAT